MYVYIYREREIEREERERERERIITLLIKHTFLSEHIPTRISDI